MPGRGKATAPELVIFDCDGVLVDSEPISNRVLARAISEAGLAVSATETSEAFAGMRLDEIATAVEARLGHELPEPWIRDFEERRAAEFESGLDAIVGADEALVRIRGAGLPVCVASQASREKTELTLGLTGLIRHFEVGSLFSSRMVERGKPAPDLFLLAADSMGCSPARCIVIEDGVLGAQAGRRAGMRVLGYEPAGDGGRLATEGATTFQSMHELPALLGITDEGFAGSR